MLRCVTMREEEPREETKNTDQQREENGPYRIVLRTKRGWAGGARNGWGKRRKKKESPRFGAAADWTRGKTTVIQDIPCVWANLTVGRSICVFFSCFFEFEITVLRFCVSRGEGVLARGEKVCCF